MADPSKNQEAKTPPVEDSNIVTEEVTVTTETQKESPVEHKKIEKTASKYRSDGKNDVTQSKTTGRSSSSNVSNKSGEASSSNSAKDSADNSSSGGGTLQTQKSARKLSKSTSKSNRNSEKCSISSPRKTDPITGEDKSHQAKDEDHQDNKPFPDPRKGGETTQSESSSASSQNSTSQKNQDTKPFPKPKNSE